MTLWAQAVWSCLSRRKKDQKPVEPTAGNDVQPDVSPPVLDDEDKRAPNIDLAQDLKGNAAHACSTIIFFSGFWAL
jgi:hypothetical protein